MAAPTTVTARQLDDGVAVVAATGELDLYRAPELRDALLRVTAAAGASVVVDLRETAFLDSTALGVLIQVTRRVRGAGGEIAIVTGESAVRRTFEITGIDRAVATCATLEEALAQVRGAAGGDHAALRPAAR